MAVVKWESRRERAMSQDAMAMERETKRQASCVEKRPKPSSGKRSSETGSVIKVYTSAWKSAPDALEITKNSEKRRVQIGEDKSATLLNREPKLSTKGQRSVE